MLQLLTMHQVMNWEDSHKHYFGNLLIDSHNMIGPKYITKSESDHSCWLLVIHCVYIVLPDNNVEFNCFLIFGFILWTTENISVLRAVLNRAKKGTNWVKSVHFWHFRQLPKTTMTFFGRATVSMVNEKSHSFSDV